MRKEAVLAYTAGIIDGEGSIHLTKGRNRKLKQGYCISLVISVGNTNEWLVQWLKMQFGGQVYYKDCQNPKWKPCWTWIIANKQAGEFLELILPYLQIKRPQAEIALDFQSRKISRHLSSEEAAIQETQRILMGAMNKKGKSYDERAG